MPGQQQDDHPRVDQVAVDLLDPGQDRRGRPRVLRRDREEERVAEGRAEGEHDREDVQEQRDLVAGVDDRARTSIGGNPISSGRDAAAGPPSRRRWRRSASTSPAGAKAAATSSSSAGRRPESEDRGRLAEQQRGGSPSLPAPSSCAATACRIGAVMLATTVGASVGQAFAQVHALAGRARRRWRRRSRRRPRAPAARGRSRRPGPSRASRRRSRGRRSRCRGR